MWIEHLEVGSLGTNCYIAGCDETNEAVLIDPGAESGRILSLIRKRGAKLVAIINTHAHWDHIGANRHIQEELPVPILIHELDAPALSDPIRNIAAFCAGDADGGQATRLLKDGDRIEFGKEQLTVLHTPGHTPGGICLLGKEVIFTGDTLFCLSIGRTDLPGGDFDALIRSIKEKLYTLEGDYSILPGHDRPSRLSVEKARNPFVNCLYDN